MNKNVKTIGGQIGLEINPKIAKIANTLMKDKVIGAISAAIAFIAVLIIAVKESFSQEIVVFSGLLFVAMFVLGCFVSYSFFGVICSILYAVNSPVIKKNSKLFVVDENNKVTPVYFLRRAFMLWDKNDQDYDWVYFVSYEGRPGMARKVSASRIFLTEDDAEAFALKQFMLQVKAFKKAVGCDEARKILTDSEISDIRTIYAYNWDNKTYGSEESIEEYYDVWEQQIKKAAKQYAEDNNKFNDAAYQADFREYGEYYSSSVYMDKVKFLYDPEQVRHFVRFYYIWKEGEKLARETALV